MSEGTDAADHADQLVRARSRLYAVEDDSDLLARQHAAERAYHESIRWAGAREPTPADRHRLTREAYTSPEIAALCAHDHGYAEGIAAAESRLSSVNRRRTREVEARMWLALAALPSVACGVLALLLGVIVLIGR